MQIRYTLEVTAYVEDSRQQEQVKKDLERVVRGTSLRTLMASEHIPVQSIAVSDEVVNLTKPEDLHTVACLECGKTYTMDARLASTVVPELTMREHIREHLEERVQAMSAAQVSEYFIANPVNPSVLI